MLLRYKDTFGKTGRASFGGGSMFYVFEDSGEYSISAQHRWVKTTALTAEESRQYFSDVVMQQKFVVLVDAELTQGSKRKITETWSGCWILNIRDKYVEDVMKQCDVTLRQFLKLIAYDVAVGVINVNNNQKVFLI